MTSLLQDVLYGFRILLKKPGFTAIASFSLALGIGANTVVCSLINTTLLRPLGSPDPDNLMVVWTVPLQHRDQRGAVNISTYFAVREKNRSGDQVRLVGVSATVPGTYTAVSLGLTLVALLACFIPTRGAFGVDPTVALRYE